jgi:hypothetical protein
MSALSINNVRNIHDKYLQINGCQFYKVSAPLSFSECNNFLSGGVPRVFSLSVVQMSLLKQHLKQAFAEFVWELWDSYRVLCGFSFFFFVEVPKPIELPFSSVKEESFPQIGRLWWGKGLSRSGMFFALFSLISFSLLFVGVQTRPFGSFIRNTGLYFNPLCYEHGIQRSTRHKCRQL